MTDPAPTAAAVLERLAPKGAPVLQLLAHCRTPDFQIVWSQGPELFRRFARLLLKQGHPTLALEVAARGLDPKRHPDDHDLLYCRALALARSGNATRTASLIDDLLRRPDLPPGLRSDGLSLAGRVRKDMAARLADPAARAARFREAFEFYRQAYDLTADPFPGINAATLALLAGDPAPSRALAARVRDAVLAQIDKPGNDADYWLPATLAEASLLLGDADAARVNYARAVGLARDARGDGDIAAMHRQLRLLGSRLPVGDDLLSLFHRGPVVVFAGRGLDRPAAPVRFPADPALEEAVRQAVREKLDDLEAHIGYCSPGCGADLLFAELMRDRGGELHLVLPFAEDDFRAERLTSGRDDLGSWGRRYDAARDCPHVACHFATTEEFLGDHVLYDFAGGVMQGLALTRAAELDVEAVPVVAVDLTQPGPDGLTAFVDRWRDAGREMHTMDLAALRAGIHLTATPTVEVNKPPAPRRPSRKVRAMLFADVAGFSGLPEPHLPAFFIAFLSLVEEQLNTAPTLFQNTWGDGLYLVFPDVVSCADFALRLLGRLEHFDFTAFGFHLPEHKQPGVRIGLHTGPVFEAYDAIIGRTNYFGSHVSRAARIEPVTVPGCAFTSEQFAALLALAPGHGFVCEPLGLQPLAKDYDVCPLYRLTTGAAGG